MSKDNVTDIRAVRRNARPVGSGDDDDQSRDGVILPPDCPVTPLGINGDTCYYISAKRQLVALKAEKHGRLGIQITLFGNYQKYLEIHWPRYDKDGEAVKGQFKAEAAASALSSAAAAAGIWRPEERERSLGAWKGEAGELILHLGNQVLSLPPTPNPWQQQTQHRPGLIGHHVYPGQDSIGAPAEQHAAAGDTGPGEALLVALESWAWQRPSIDPILMLGWIGQAMICGALDWRTTVWLTGGTGAGKSTMHKLVGQIFGQSLVRCADPTEAGISQKLGLQTLPVAIDEAESDTDNRKLNALVKLARNSASGSIKLRGGADHKGVEFVCRSSFILSSVLLPPLLAQDVNRMAILDLNDLDPAAKPPDMDPATWRKVGQQLLRRMIDGWGRFDATLAWFRTQLAASGHTGRGQDTFGTLLACADILLYDEAPSAATSGAWCMDLDAAAMAETSDNERDERNCLNHLLTQSPEVRRGGAQRTTAEWIAQAAGFGQDMDEGDARRVIETLGLKFLPAITRKEPGGPVREITPARLAFSNTHNGLAGMFTGTHWEARSGAKGAYIQSLRRLPGAERLTSPLWFAGATTKAFAVPIDQIVTRQPLPSLADLPPK